jgi:hypothetical protein
LFLAALFLVPFLVSLDPVAATPTTFSFNWSGTTPAPQPWSPGAINDWDLIVHNRDHQDSMYQVNAVHGADCSAFPNRHPVTTFAGSVFICNNHLMTALNGGGYSEIVFTPNQLIDFSTSGTVSLSLSTLKDDDRDWLDIWISPFSQQLLLPSGGIPPDLQGPTANALIIGEQASIPTTAGLQQFRNCGAISTCVETGANGTGATIEGCVAPLGGVSASRRDKRVLTLTPNHVTYSIIVNGIPCVLLDTNYNPIGFTRGVVQFSHHSYAPDEGTTCNYPGCIRPVPYTPAGNTWHWSNIEMSPVIPFTMLRGDMPIRGIQGCYGAVCLSPTQTVHFAAPSPANSFLRFSALADYNSIKLTLSNGQVISAVPQIQKGDGKDGVTYGSFVSYWTPIPAGITAVTFAAADPNPANQPWTVQDVSIWSETPLGSAAPPSPSPTPTPVVTPTPSPSASPSPTPSPISISGAPCTVTIDGVKRIGKCSGTFNP